MGILSDFFIADSSNASEYDGGPDFAPEDRCQFKGITPLEAGTLLAILRGDEYSTDPIDEFELITPEDAEQWTMSVPQDMVLILAEMEEARIPDVCQRLAEATREELGWSADDFSPVITQLAALARRATENGKAMYLWNSL